MVGCVEFDLVVGKISMVQVSCMIMQEVGCVLEPLARCELKQVVEYKV